jgi:23S rRNA pseudouridine1911/1915/1917 synthase
VTHYRVLERFAAVTLLSVRLETGRTHQIRVHMAHIRHPLVGDPAYGARPRFPRGGNDALNTALAEFPRQALHAVRLGLFHPRTGEETVWEIPMVSDMESLLARLREIDANGAD